MVPADAGGGLMRGDLLADPVEGLDEALAAVDAFDGALVAGLLRPGAAQAAAVAGLAEAVAGTPLAARVAEAAERAAAGAAVEDHFVALAAARSALLGSVHDALALRIGEAVGRPVPEEGSSPDVAEGESSPPAGPEHAPNLLAAARSWLCDLARSGWRGIDRELVAGAAPVVSAMLPDPALRRRATLLDGFAAELAASCPGTTLERVPVRRWADLWARGLLLTVPGSAGERPGGPVTGRLLPLGIDVQEHATAVQAQVHAVFEPADGGAPRLVRAGVSAPKPDTVVGAGLWQLLRPRMSLLGAVSEGRSMELDAMPVTAEGDLVWDDERARAGEPADPFATARVRLSAATSARVAPLDRHPVRIAVPVLVEGYAAHSEEGRLAFDLAGRRLAVDTDRMPAAGPLTPEAVAASHACVGLLRWDAGEFLLQPLAVEATVRKKTIAVHAGAWAGGTTDKAGVRAEKAATDAVAVLRERAGRLLRK
ncbi:hypothetical protein [Streptomyces parvus]|uniref:hypothetical protein n=1 Tax=Streptomyces parvus TaxID=66428 RepID=UPI0028ABB302|nr:hypothetical protein [Streptomyces parvus]